MNFFLNEQNTKIMAFSLLHCITVLYYQRWPLKQTVWQFMVRA